MIGDYVQNLKYSEVNKQLNIRKPGDYEYLDSRLPKTGAKIEQKQLISDQIIYNSTLRCKNQGPL
jgi:hypothetical protein